MHPSLRKFRKLKKQNGGPGPGKKGYAEKEMPDSTLLKKDTVVNEPLVEKEKIG
jgi:hypothetical protein